MNNLEFDRQSVVFKRADPALVSHYVNEHVGSHQIAIQRRSRSDAMLSHRKLSALDICHIRYGNQARITSPALEDIYHLQIVLNGHCQRAYAGHTQVFGPGDVLLINPDEVVDLVYSNDCGKFVVKLPRTIVRETAAAQKLIVTGNELRFSASRYRLDALPGLPELLQLMLHDAGSPTVSEHVKTLYARAVCAKLLDNLPTNTSADDSLADAGQFGRLIDFIDGNLQSPIGVNTLARCANMSPRSLHSLFKGQVGVSPMQFIRRRRLEYIHQRLVDPHELIISITDIAFEYGFTHLGRFSSYYQRRYGELPSETLKRHH